MLLPPPATGANAKLRYQITSGNKGGVFDIEPEVGTIFIAQPLDYEQQKRYKLLVLASDGKWEDYAAVVVTVVNKNDEAPVFSMNEYYGSVTEELDGSPVFVLQVRGSARGLRWESPVHLTASNVCVILSVCLTCCDCWPWDSAQRFVRSHGPRCEKRV